MIKHNNETIKRTFFSDKTVMHSNSKLKSVSFVIYSSNFIYFTFSFELHKFQCLND